MSLRETAQRIKEIANILDVISEYVALKKVGRNYVGLCPFHSDRKPSFTVSEERQIFHCFGCGAGGDVIGFYMKYHQLSFVEAVKELARRYGIELKEGELSPQEKAKAAKREALFRLNEKAQRFFSQMFWAAQSGAPAREYLKNRGLSPETIKTFGLGYAPASYDSLASHLRLAGIDLKLAEEAGLLVAREDGSFYDRFRERVIFPIYDIQGRVAGFGGRIISQGEPKYLNTPETAVYHKGQLLYGLFHTKNFIRSAGFGFVVEGYLDLIALYEAGVREVVATLGTALTPQHVRVMKGLATDWYLVFDADEAGVKAAMRAAPLFLNENLFPKVISLPEGEDPDSFVRKFGPEAFLKEKERALPIFDFLLKTLEHRFSKAPEGRVAIIRELRPVFEALKDPVIFDLYVARLAEATGVSEASIKKALKGGLRVESPQSSFSEARYFERTVLEFFLFHPEFFSEFDREAVEEIFTHDLYRRLFKEVAYLVETQGAFSLEDLSFEDLELQALVSEIILSPPAFEEISPAKVAEEIKVCLLRRRKRGQLEALLQAIKEAEKEGRLEEAKRLLREYQDLRCGF